MDSQCAKCLLREKEVFFNDLIRKFRNDEGHHDDDYLFSQIGHVTVIEPVEDRVVPEINSVGDFA